MFNWFDSRKKTLPVQVLENRNDIDELKQHIAYTYGYNGELTTDTTSCPQGSTDVPNNTTYGFLIDNVGHVFKILGVTSSIVTIKYYATVTGPKGDVGQGYNEMGEWTSSNEYHPYDVVSYNGSSYVCIAEVHNSDIPPSQDATHWTIFALGANMYELIYDIDTKNTIGGTAYTSGINYGTIINYDFTPYKKLKIYAYRPQNGPFTYEINLEQKDISQNVYSGSGICYSYQEPDNYFVYSSASISENKQQLRIIKCGYTMDFFTTPTLSTTCYIYRLEGIK